MIVYVEKNHSTRNLINIKVDTLDAQKMEEENKSLDKLLLGTDEPPTMGFGLAKLGKNKLRGITIGNFGEDSSKSTTHLYLMCLCTELLAD
jgi:hypothetical protein